MARQITSHEVDTIKWWLETRKFAFDLTLDIDTFCFESGLYDTNA